uniref:NAD(P)-binding domain-containing protein n=1 Tax=Eptatretus burgeri TaxID=7764 RepID=A0A8C4NN42_EPTBU
MNLENVKKINKLGIELLGFSTVSNESWYASSALRVVQLSLFMFFPIPASLPVASPRRSKNKKGEPCTLLVNHRRLQTCKVSKKLAVLGATGQTGQCVVQQALQHGHVVVAIVRNPQKMKISHSNLKVVKVNIFSSEELVSHLEGQDAIISCLGFSISFLSPVTGYLDSMKAIVDTMQKVGVTRLVTMTSWYTNGEASPQCPWTIRWVLLPMIKSVLLNMQEMEHFLTNDCGDINYTIVRPPGLVNGSCTDKEFRTTLNAFSVTLPDNCDIGLSGFHVSRADVARFMLNVLSTDKWDKKAVAIALI